MFFLELLHELFVESTEASRGHNAHAHEEALDAKNDACEENKRVLLGKHYSEGIGGDSGWICHIFISGK